MVKNSLLKIAKLLAAKISKWCQVHLTKKEASDVVGWLALAVVASLGLGLAIGLAASPAQTTPSPTTYQISGKIVQLNNIQGNQQVNVNGPHPQSSPSSQIKNSPLKK